MRRHRWAALLALIGAGCSIGPSYHEPEVAPAGATVGLSPRPDSVRAFYDSLAMADSAAAAAPRTLQPDSADLAWLAILKDSTLLSLVNQAVRENRDVQTAVAINAIIFNLVFESNPARTLYERLGWTQIGRIPRGVNDEPALIYWRNV